MKFYIKDFFSKCDQIRKKLRIWSHLLKKSMMKNFIFCGAYHVNPQRTVYFMATQNSSNSNNNDDNDNSNNNNNNSSSSSSSSSNNNNNIK